MVLLIGSPSKEILAYLSFLFFDSSNEMIFCCTLNLLQIVATPESALLQPNCPYM
jgi:hypothetical protein